MAEPLGRHPRPARRSGLTSPGQVRTPTAPAATPDPAPSQEPWTSRTAGERQDAHARNHLAKLLAQESSRKRATRIDRWIEGKLARRSMFRLALTAVVWHVVSRADEIRARVTSS